MIPYVHRTPVIIIRVGRFSLHVCELLVLTEQ